MGPWLACTMRRNRISGGTYMEPYAGGAGAALFLLLGGYVDRIVINDIDPAVHAFWHSVIHEGDAFIKLVRTTPCTMETWVKQREIIRTDPSDLSALELGFDCFFMNRTNRSGIINGGVIGGYDQNQVSNIDARYNVPELVRRIECIRAKRRRIELFNLDAINLLETRGQELDPRSLVYMDPPYFDKGQQLYRNAYEPEDHAKIAQKVLALETPWVVTYDNVPDLRALYDGVDCEEFNITYSTHYARPRATEILFHSGLILPVAPQLSRRAAGYPSEWDQVA